MDIQLLLFARRLTGDYVTWKNLPIGIVNDRVVNVTTYMDIFGGRDCQSLNVTTYMQAMRRSFR